MTKWFTADTHFSHAVLASKYRGFDRLEDHDEEIVRIWNHWVQPGDEVYHLGDFAWKHTELFVDRLNGRIHLILGNHDDLKKWQHDMFASVQDVLYLHSKHVGGYGIYLSHYPHRSWRKKEYGGMHLYGHVHGNIPDLGRSMDVGWDRWKRPVSLTEVRGILLKRDIHQLWDEEVPI